MISLERFPAPPERQVQAGIVALFQSVGIRVRSTSQYRASHVAIGIPDLILLGDGWGGWYEVKTYQRGYQPFDRSTWVPKPLAPAQAAFLADAARAGQVAAWGGLLEAEALLIQQGYCVRSPHLTIVRRDG